MNNVEDFDTMLRYNELIIRYDVEQQMPDFQISAALYKDSDGFKQFGIIIIDRRFDEAKKYVFQLGCRFCSKDMREWFVQIISRQFIDIIKQSHRNTLDEIKKTQNKLNKLYSM